ncbi:MAG: hypothetical protein U5K37_09020 [Natrialbaceae archaeon]|nr:hypothetical protein [Natrialbaceae archaeon]
MDDEAATLDYSVRHAEDGAVEITFTHDGRSFTVTTDRSGVEELIGALRQARDAIDATHV